MRCSTGVDVSSTKALLFDKFASRPFAALTATDPFSFPVRGRGGIDTHPDTAAVPTPYTLTQKFVSSRGGEREERIDLDIDRADVLPRLYATYILGKPKLKPKPNRV